MYTREDWRKKGPSYIVLKKKTDALVRKYLARGSSLFDVGSGSGDFPRRLSGEYRVTASDVENFSGFRPFVVLDANEPWPISGEFDAVTAWCVIEHLENPSAFAREALRHLRDGGVFFVSFPAVSELRNRLHFLFTGDMYRYTPTDNTHISIFTRSTIKKIFSHFEVLAEGIYKKHGWHPKTAYIIFRKRSGASAPTP